MAKDDRIEFDLTSLPDKREFEINGESFGLRLRYSEIGDCYYVDCYDENDVLLVAGERLVYGEQLFGSITDPRLPTTPMVPYDEDQTENEVTLANFQKSVFIYLPTDSTTAPDDAALEAQKVFAISDDDDTDDTDNDDTDDAVSGDPENPYGTDETVGAE